ncbi:hypothetical protein CCAX7_55860 [Capsulimonas corticalis]|uniref:Uncharacterized protein n=1 Tax=Capsulimonas corticalis TaxID=2219043 RepID=A0A402D0V3_9BACT|nr:hypothetical protein [Capsulimonas corticalis]BDI33535.1 hypothetical protein CCAX7_55860 [Capsulimonas corticalis]
MQSPPGTITSTEVAIYDAHTLRRWTRSEKAQLWIGEYHQAHSGQWPSIKQIMHQADVGQGTAHRALVAARSERSKGN